MKALGVGTEITRQTGISVVPNNGYPELFIGGIRPYPPEPFTHALFYSNSGNGTLTRRDSALGIPLESESVGSCWGDFNGDGYLDLFVLSSWYTVDGFSSLFLNNGDGSFRKVSGGEIALDYIPGCAASAADYDDDGRLDILVVAHKQKILYRNLGGGEFAKMENAVTDDINNCSNLAWGNYNNDGRIDLAITGFGPQEGGWDGRFNLLFRNEGDGKFTRIVLGDSQYSTSAAWADYDNDGYLDLFITQFNTNRNLLYHNNGDETFAQVLVGTFAARRVNCYHCAWADYDNDGFLDVVTGHDSQTVTGPVWLYHNNGNSNHWLTVLLTGTASNRDAIGAKVRVKATIGGKTFWQLRTVSGGRATSQDDPRPHFGLGDAPAAEVVRIEWPSGAIQELRDVAANTFLRVTEPPVLKPSGLARDGSFRMEFVGNVNSQYEVLCSSDLVNWEIAEAGTCTARKTLFTDCSGSCKGKYFQVRLK